MFDITQEDLKEARKVLAKFSKKKTQKTCFYHLCFCIMAPQISFQNNQKAQKALRCNRFFDWPEDPSQKQIKTLRGIAKYGRFVNNKTKYLLEMKKNWEEIYKIIKSDISDVEKRNWLYKNVKGIGMKASSHFLRNIGCQDLAILDVHIMRYMGYDYESPKNLKDYLTIEGKFRMIAAEKGMNPAELDAIVWKKYSKTAWVDFRY